MRGENPAQAAHDYRADRAAVVSTERPPHVSVLLVAALNVIPSPFHRPRNKYGATAIEYGLMVAVIATAVFATALVLGGNVDATLSLVSKASVIAVDPSAADSWR